MEGLRLPGTNTFSPQNHSDVGRKIPWHDTEDVYVWSIPVLQGSTIDLSSRNEGIKCIKLTLCWKQKSNNFKSLKQFFISCDMKLVTGIVPVQL